MKIVFSLSRCDICQYFPCYSFPFFSFLVNDILFLKLLLLIGYTDFTAWVCSAFRLDGLLFKLQKYPWATQSKPELNPPLPRALVCKVQDGWFSSLDPNSPGSDLGPICLGSDTWKSHSHLGFRLCVYHTGEGWSFVGVLGRLKTTMPGKYLHGPGSHSLP